MEDINQANENKSPTTISSTYSSDVFDDSNIDVNNAGQNIESNFSKVKKDLHEKLLTLFETPTFKTMGASLSSFNYPVYSFEYLHPDNFSSGYGIMKIASNNPNRFIE